MAKSEQITFESCGVTCAADLYLPDSSKFPYPRPGVVIGHGTAMIKQFLADQATHLAHAGYITMAIDYRTFGESKGEPRAQLFPLDQVEDFRNALSHLEQRTDLVDPERIGIWGVSFAGGVAMYTGAVEPRFKVVVSQSPSMGRLRAMSMRNPYEWNSLQDLITEERRRLYKGEKPRMINVMTTPEEGHSLTPGDKLTIGFNRAANAAHPTKPLEVTMESIEKVNEFFPDRVIDYIYPRPVLIVTNGKYNLNHPLDQAEEAFHRAREPKKLVVLNYDVVGLYVEPGLGEAMGHAIEWFNKHL
jgi:hypothetical protein